MRHHNIPHFGKDTLNELVKTTRECQDKADALKQRSVIKRALDELTACLLIRDNDQSKGNSLLNGLVSQLSMKNETCVSVVNEEQSMSQERRKRCRCTVQLQTRPQGAPGKPSAKEELT